MRNAQKTGEDSRKLDLMDIAVELRNKYQTYSNNEQSVILKKIKSVMQLEGDLLKVGLKSGAIVDKRF